MSSIVDFQSLSNAVANWMRRSGNTDFTGNVGDFIALCEARLNYGSDDPDFPSPPLRVAQMQVTSATLVFPNSTNTAVLPSDFLQLFRIYALGATASNNQKLTYVTPNQLDATLSRVGAGPQEFYTIIGNNVVLPNNVQTTTSVIVGYFQKIAPLSSSNTVNWLLTAHPGVYMAGTMLEAYLFLGEDDNAAKWARVFTGHTRSFRRQDLKGRYSGDAMQIKTDVGNP